jgi:hypothetical protein
MADSEYKAWLFYSERGFCRDAEIDQQTRNALVGMTE